MPICPEHAASTSPVRCSLVAGQPPPFSARIVWDHIGVARWGLGGLGPPKEVEKIVNVNVTKYVPQICQI